MSSRKKVLTELISKEPLLTSVQGLCAFTELAGTEVLPISLLSLGACRPFDLKAEKRKKGGADKELSNAQYNYGISSLQTPLHIGMADGELRAGLQVREPLN